MRILRETSSICPECKMVIPSIIYEEDNKVYISKTCPEHGKLIDLYWGDYELYVKAETYSHDGVLLDNPSTKEKNGCPMDCGICTEHKSTTTQGIIDVTNR